MTKEEEEKMIKQVLNKKKSTHPLIDHAGKSLYDFKGTIPPWTSYCRACLRRVGLNPFETGNCPDAEICPHYPFKHLYKPSEVGNGKI